MNLYLTQVKVNLYCTSQRKSILASLAKNLFAGPLVDTPRISMDIYEPVTMRRALGKFGVEVVVSVLGVGDYLLSDSVCIERKTISDFLASMYSGRLGYQLQLLANSFKMPFLLIEGRPEYYPRTINMKSFYAYLSKLVLSSPIGLIQTPDMPASALLISLMFQKLGNGPSIPHLRLRNKARSETEMVLRVMDSFPGIGPVLSTRMLRKLKTLRSVFQAQEKTIAEIKGVGKRKAKSLMTLLDYVFES